MRRVVFYRLLVKYEELQRFSLGNANNTRNYDDSRSSRPTFSKSSYRRSAPAGNEDDDYDAWFGSDEETFQKPSEDNRATLMSAFPLATSSSNSTQLDTTKRVDWAKMRRTDTANDMTKWKEYPPVVKEFYDELPDIAQMADEDVQALRSEKNNIVVSWFDPCNER